MMDYVRFDKIKLQNLPLIGSGRTAFVYDMGDGKVLKLFRPSIPYESVVNELVRTQLAHSYGLPVPNAFDIVRSDSSYGILMEKIGGIGLEQEIIQHPEERLNLISRFAESVKATHQISLSGSEMPDVRKESISICGRLDRTFCSADEAQKIRRVFERIPSADTFVHGDCHPGNAIDNDGIIHFFDLTFAGKGHPVFDLLCMYSHYVFLPSFITEEDYVLKNGMTKDEAAALYHRFLESYYPEAKASELSQIREQIRGIHAARICLSTVMMPGVFTDEILQEAKNRALGSS